MLSVTTGLLSGLFFIPICVCLIVVVGTHYSLNNEQSNSQLFEQSNNLTDKSVNGVGPKWHPISSISLC